MSLISLLDRVLGRIERQLPFEALTTSKGRLPGSAIRQTGCRRSDRSRRDRLEKVSTFSSLDQLTGSGPGSGKQSGTGMKELPKRLAGNAGNRNEC